MVAEMEEIDVIELFKEAGFQVAHLQNPSSTLPGTTGIKTTRPRFFFEHDDGKADLVALCKQYLSYLERKVHSFLAAHAA